MATKGDNKDPNSVVNRSITGSTKPEVKATWDGESSMELDR